MLHARPHIYLACLLALLAGSVTARAENLWPIDQRFSVQLGAFLVDTDTSVRLDGTNNNFGTEVDFDDEFGLSDQTRFRVDGYWRFLDRHKLRFLYFDSRQSETRNISRTIDFGDTEFPVNAIVEASVQIQIIEVAYEYSFLRRENFELSGSLGLHNLSIEAGLSGTASSNAGQGGISESSEADGNGPLPVIGLRGIWALSDHFYFDLQAQFFAIQFENFDGSLEDYKVGFVWQPFRNAGIGIAYNGFRTTLDVEETRFNGRLRFEYAGPVAFFTLAF